MNRLVIDKLELASRPEKFSTTSLRTDVDVFGTASAQCKTLIATTSVAVILALMDVDDF